MKKKIIIDANFPSETRVVLLDKNNNIEDIEYSSAGKKQIKGNIYLAKVTRIEPSLQAAFVDYGDNKSGFLPFAEIHPDYYHIPSTDKKDGPATTSNPSWQEIAPPKITPEDLEDRPGDSPDHLAIQEEIDIEAIKAIVDRQIPPNFDIEADEMDVDNFSEHQSNEEHKINPKYKIHEVIKKGQILLVQATKEERGNKGASFTTFISLAGKYCVFMPNTPDKNGISRKISNSEERRKLKNLISKLVIDSNHAASSVIARTAGMGHTIVEIKKDYDYLIRLWNKIREVTLKSQAPCFIHQEDGILLKTIRDMFNHYVKEIIVQGSDAYNACLKFMRDILPNQVKAVKEYKNKTPIFTKFGVEEQLTKLYQPTVFLPSGGYIVINPTEALISIDVNSGKATGERNIEGMALKINIEAAKEIARQARLRSLSGLIVIDFIDMMDNRHKRIVERSLREFFSRDKAKLQIAPISAFGLLEMCRQRMYPSFLEIHSNICSHCSGKGIVRADESNAMLILRTIENEIYHSNYDIINIYGFTSSILYLLNNKRAEIELVESKYAIKLNFYIDRDATADSYSIEKIKLSRQSHSIDPVAPALQDTSNIYNQNNQQLLSSRRKVNNSSNNYSADNRNDDNMDGYLENTIEDSLMDISEEITTHKKINQEAGQEINQEIIFDRVNKKTGNNDEEFQVKDKYSHGNPNRNSNRNPNQNLYRRNNKSRSAKNAPDPSGEIINKDIGGNSEELEYSASTSGNNGNSNNNSNSNGKRKINRKNKKRITRKVSVSGKPTESKETQENITDTIKNTSSTSSSFIKGFIDKIIK